MDEQQWDPIFQREKGSFHGYLLMTCGNISTGAKRQRFYTTFAARYHGLSRGGIRILSYFGIITKMSTFDKMQAIQFQKQVEITR